MNKLILIRHGQSRWNKSNRFTGWVDVPLSEQGVKEALEAAQTIKGLGVDVCFTSTLARAQTTLQLILPSLGKVGVVRREEGRTAEWAHYTELAGEEEMPIIISEEINERYYGDLQGLNKDEARAKWGEEQVHTWRRSYDVAPPNGECLKEVCERVTPYFKERIIPLLEQGKNVLVAAHGNSLRAMIKDIEGISDHDIPGLELPTGKPIVYTYDEGKLAKDE